MSNLLHLVKGEIKRLIRYKILFFGIFVSLIWIMIVAFQNQLQTRDILPILIVTDAGMMAVLLVGSSYYFEKQENTIQSLFVAPISLSQIVISKLIAAVFSAFISLCLVGGFTLIYHQLNLQIFKLILTMFVIVISHTALGYVLILRSKDFLSMLVKFSGVMLLFYTPTLLLSLDIIPASFELVAFLSPSYAGEYLVRSCFTNLNVSYQLIAFLYLSILGFLVYRYYVYPRFQKNVTGGV